MTAGLTRHVAAVPLLAALAAKAMEDYGDTYCAGRIEASLREILDAQVCVGGDLP